MTLQQAMGVNSKNLDSTKVFAMKHKVYLFNLNNNMKNFYILYSPCGPTDTTGAYFKQCNYAGALRNSFMTVIDYEETDIQMLLS